VAAWTRLRTRLQSRRGVTVAPPWPDLPSSKATRSRKGPGPRVHRRLSGHRRVGSGRHLRALSRAGSTAARSPSGERRTLASGPAGGATSPAGWPPADSSLSFGFGGDRGGEEEMKMTLRFQGATRARFCSGETHAQPLIGNGRLTSFGLDSAQAGGEKAGPSLCCFNIHVGAW
jgi:hypothetical protein